MTMGQPDAGLLGNQYTAPLPKTAGAFSAFCGHAVTQCDEAARIGAILPDAFVVRPARA